MTVYFFALLNFYLSVIIILYNVKINKNAIYLAFFLFGLGIFGLLHNFTFDEEWPMILAIFRGHFLPLIYLLGPMLYLYVRGTITDTYQLKKTDYWHFLPAVFSFITIIPFIFSPFSYKLQIAKMIIENPRFVTMDKLYWIIPQHVHFFLRAASGILYSFASLTLISNSSKIFEQNQVPKSQKNLIVRWLYSLNILSIILFSGYIPLSFYLIQVTAAPFRISEMAYNFFDRATGYSYCVIPLTVLVFPQILYGLPIGPKVSKASQKDFWEDTFTLVEEDPFVEVSKKIVDYLKEQKPYLKADFNLDTLSEELQIPKHHLYYCFSNIIKVKFSKIRNKLRVEHAKNLLLEGKSENLKLEAIGFESGFPSRSHFFATFKEETGLTPSEFLEENQI